MQPYAPPPMMQPQPPPRGGGTNVVLIVSLVVGIFVVLPIMLLVCAGVFGYVRASRARAAYTSYAPTGTTTMTGTSSFTETYPTTNGLIVAHYPSDFAAKSIDEATIRLTRNNTDGSADFISVAGVANPISDDVNEFSRVLVQQMKKNIESSGDRWTETSRTRTTCFRSYSGLEIDGTYTAKSSGTKVNVRICYFMRPDKGYEMKTVVPATRESSDLPTLQSIVDATEIK